MGKIIAFIPAKGNSTRLPNKNIRILGNKPLFCHAIDIALNSKLINKVVIDSDSDVILAKGAQMGAIPLKRIPELATNNADGNDLAYWEASNYKDFDIIVQIMPTSPFIKPESIDNAINYLIVHDLDSMAGVWQETFYGWIEDRPAYLINGRIPNSFDKEPLIYETMGLCITRTKYVLAHRKRINPNNCYPYYFTSKIETIDINTLDDFKFAEIVWQGLHKN